MLKCVCGWKLEVASKADLQLILDEVVEIEDGEAFCVCPDCGNGVLSDTEPHYVILDVPFQPPYTNEPILPLATPKPQSELFRQDQPLQVDDKLKLDQHDTELLRNVRVRLVPPDKPGQFARIEIVGLAGNLRDEDVVERGQSNEIFEQPPLHPTTQAMVDMFESKADYVRKNGVESEISGRVDEVFPGSNPFDDPPWYLTDENGDAVYVDGKLVDRVSRERVQGSLFPPEPKNSVDIDDMI